MLATNMTMMRIQVFFRIFPLGAPCSSAVIAENPHTFEEVKDPKVGTSPLTLQLLNSQEFDCSGKAVGSYPHPTLTICDEFYTCTGDKRTFRHDCAQGTLYDSTTGNCDIFEVRQVWLAGGANFEMTL